MITSKLVLDGASLGDAIDPILQMLNKQGSGGIVRRGLEKNADYLSLIVRRRSFLIYEGGIRRYIGE